MKPATPGRIGCWVALSLVMVLLPHTTGAQQPIRPVVPRASPSWQERVDMLLDNGAADKALELLGSALASNSGDHEAHWRVARASYALGIQSEEHDEANRWYREAVRHSELGRVAAPDDLNVLRWSVIATGTLANAKGVGPRETARYAEEAWGLINRLLELEPDDPIGHSAMGSIHAEIMTMTGFERFLARRLLGMDAVRQANWDDALYHQRRAVSLDPGNILYRVELGKALGWLGRIDEAVDQLTLAVTLPARDPLDRVYLERAVTLRSELAARLSQR